MKRNFVLVGLALLLLTGCSAVGKFPHSSVTNVLLQENNYCMVKPNAIGTSTGFSLFGLLPMSAPRYTNAMTDLYDSAFLSNDRAYALANVVQEYSNAYLLLFSVPKLTVRADIIEFVDKK